MTKAQVVRAVKRKLSALTAGASEVTTKVKALRHSGACEVLVVHRPDPMAMGTERPFVVRIARAATWAAVGKQCAAGVLVHMAGGAR